MYSNISGIPGVLSEAMRYHTKDHFGTLLEGTRHTNQSKSLITFENELTWGIPI